MCTDLPVLLQNAWMVHEERNRSCCGWGLACPLCWSPWTFVSPSVQGETNSKTNRTWMRVRKEKKENETHNIRSMTPFPHPSEPLVAHFIFNNQKDSYCKMCLRGGHSGTGVYVCVGACVYGVFLISQSYLCEQKSGQKKKTYTGSLTLQKCEIQK